MILVIISMGLMFRFSVISLEEESIKAKTNNIITHAKALLKHMTDEYTDLNTLLDNDYRKNYIKDFSSEIDARILVVNREYKVLFDTNTSYEEKIIKNNEVDQSIDRNIHIGYYKINKKRVSSIAIPIIYKDAYKGSILIMSSLEGIYSNINTYIERLIVLASICVIITVVTGFIFVEKISSPLESITDSVKKIVFGRYNEEINEEGSDEIKVLTNSFKVLIEKFSQVDDQRKQFVSNVSHELRTPLTSIKLLSEALIEDENVDKETYREFLIDIDGEVDRLNSIIDDLLSLVNLEKKELELKLEKVNVRDLLFKTCVILSPLAEQKNIDIHFIKEAKTYSMLDKNKMMQCFINIVSNSIKYNKENGFINIYLSETKDTIKVVIEDSGIGIEEKDIPFIFDRFYRVDKARSKKIGGVGLGLSIVHQIIKLHQGDIKVESKIGEGTKFTIVIPKRLI